MTREIKFRYIYKHISTGNTETKKYSLNQLEQTLTTFLSPVFDFREYTLLNRSQYTGLKDSKGVEIYEGDIVIIPKWSVNRKYRIVFESGMFRLVNGDRKDYDYSKISLSTCAGEISCEVVGNIYESEREQP